MYAFLGDKSFLCSEWNDMDTCNLPVLKYNTSVCIQLQIIQTRKTIIIDDGMVISKHKNENT